MPDLTNRATLPSAATSRPSFAGSLWMPGLYELRHVPDVNAASGWSNAPVCGRVRVEWDGVQVTETWVMYTTYVFPTEDAGDGVAITCTSLVTPNNRESWLASQRALPEADGAFVSTWTYGASDCAAVTASATARTARHLGARRARSSSTPRTSERAAEPDSAGHTTSSVPSSSSAEREEVQLLPGTVEIVVFHPDGSLGAVMGGVRILRLITLNEDLAANAVNHSNYRETWQIHPNAPPLKKGESALLLPSEELPPAPSGTVQRVWSFYYTWLSLS